MSEITNTPQTFVEYSPRTWVNGESITADKLNNIEQGIVRLSNQIKDALSVDIDDSSSSASQETELAAAGSLAEKIVSVAEGLDGTFLKTANAENTYLYKNNPTADYDDMRTMTGNLIIAKETPAIYFRKENSLENVGGIYHIVDNLEQNRIAILQRVDESAGAEGYFLPPPSQHDNWTTYNIMTTKYDDDADLQWGSDIGTYIGTTYRTCKFYRRGNIIIVRMLISLTATTTNSLQNIGTIPEGFRPITTVQSGAGLYGTSGAGDETFYCSLTAAGGFGISHATTGSSGHTATIRHTICYPI